MVVPFSPSMVHPLMVSPFLALATLWHMMHAKSNMVGTNQQVAPLLYWLRVTMVELQQVIFALTSVYLVYSTMSQRLGISTCLAGLGGGSGACS